MELSVADPVAASRMGGKHPGRGFTLVELLVVIAIIALLVSILMPSLMGARELAQMAGCAANARTLALASLLYAEDNAERIMPYDAWGIYPPGKLDTAWNNNNLSGDQVNCWGDFLIWDNLAQPEAFASPTDNWASSLDCESQGRSKLSYGIMANLYKHRDPGKIDHWGGQVVSAATDTIRWRSPLGSGAAPPKFYGPSVAGDIIRPTTTFLLSDSRGNPEGHVKPGPCYDACTQSWAAQGFHEHRGYTCHYAFFDGHVDLLAWEDVFKNPFDPDRYMTNWGGPDAPGARAHQNLIDAGVQIYHAYFTSGEPIEIFAAWVK